jgi:hypothetical protein
MIDAKRCARQEDGVDKNAENNDCDDGKLTLHRYKREQRVSTIVDSSMVAVSTGSLRLEGCSSEFRYSGLLWE